ncbi:flavodoxin FldA [Silvibacterium sp.]|uniref:flavodoxin FldA n=1 Tax=Silvibacterium sp. TaxID=1964179 RepID=UPI0039E5DC92
MKVTVIYGTDYGNTRIVAEQIASRIGGRVVEIASATSADFEDCDLLILGTPTSGCGDLQADWDGRLRSLATMKLSGKRIALFGLGDQRTYCDTFADAVGVLYDEVTRHGVEVIGATATEGYEFDRSLAVRDGIFVGLVLDEDNQQEETEARIHAWVDALKAHPVQSAVA